MSARTVLVAAVALAAGVAGGLAYERGDLFPHGAGETAATEKKILYWVAPMDPNYRRDAPGKSPMGMDLIPVYEGEEPGAESSDADVVQLSPAVINTMGVRTASAERAALGGAVHTVGYVALDEDKTSHVHVRKEGWIEGLKIRSLGAEVTQGEVLFEYFSPELAASSFEYVRDLERGDTWAGAGGRAKLKALGVSERQIEEIAKSRKAAERIRVYAPQGGVVVQLGVGEGMYIRPDQTLMSLSDLSTVWVIADVFESQSDRVRPGMEAEARLAHLPDRVWHGTVDYIYPELDPTTRTLRVRLRFDNADLALRPNMFASITLAGTARAEAVVVPAEAVIRTGRSDRVVLALGDGRFRAVPVTVGFSDGERTEILDGLDDGAQVVSSGQFLIDSEASLKAGFARMEDPAPDAAPEVIAETEGTVNAVDAQGRTVNVTHAPIPVLGWPAMTMDFGLAEGVDPAAFTVGGKVSLGIGKDAAGAFVVVTAQASAPEVWGEGVVDVVKDGGRVLTVTHDPIPALGWPTMTMDFTVEPPPAAAPAVGERIRFALGKDAAGMPIIVEIAASADTAAAGVAQ
ncbi:efflux RND transporter periplasmic adaptor subunit [Caenispirillum salinarum]|uniref:efflux RND transporter periplasmic adaptor subunit n=1 Tax=Caenispirillum salinarum TaxID=859058 RepID=UPI000A0784A1|nr:efflux RND transporter periplasmic adaptor subunit [Caenispirillum salinarum]